MSASHVVQPQAAGSHDVVALVMNTPLSLQERLAVADITHVVSELVPTSAQVHARRLREVGRLAATLAERVGDPLALIRGGLSAITDVSRGMEAAASGGHVRGRPDPSLLGEIGEECRDSVSRVEEVFDELCDYARSAFEPGRDCCSIEDAVDRALILTRMEFEGRAVVSSDLRRTGCVDMSRGDLLQILLNLLVNSLDAILERGSGTDRGFVRISGAAHNGSLLRLIVTDSGCGLDTLASRDRASTTHGGSVREGLGLRISRHLAESRGGRLVLESSRGLTSAVLELPYTCMSSCGEPCFVGYVPGSEPSSNTRLKRRNK